MLPHLQIVKRNSEMMFVRGDGVILVCANAEEDNNFHADLHSASGIPAIKILESQKEALYYIPSQLGPINSMIYRVDLVDLCHDEGNGGCPTSKRVRSLAFTTFWVILFPSKASPLILLCNKGKVRHY